MNRYGTIKRTTAVFVAAALVVLAAGAASATEPGLPRLLVVDSTKSFASTLRVGGLMGALRAAGLMTVEIHLSEATSPHDDPLPLSPEEGEPFDLMIFLPRGLDDGTSTQIWLVSNGFDRLAAPVLAAVRAAAQTIDLVFAGSAHAVDVSQDLYPGLLWGSYRARGWMR
jgi:hypothetical protein